MEFRHHKHLRSFHAVATAGGFTAAASRLNVGQPTITQQVKELEETFNVELFSRNGRQTALTDAGRKLHEITIDLFGYEEEALRLLSSFRSPGAEELRIVAVSPEVGVSVWSTIRTADASARITMDVTTNEAAHAALQNSTADLIVITVGWDGDRLHSAPYRRTPLQAILRIDHPWARKRNITLTELTRARVILQSERGELRRRLVEVCERHGLALASILELDNEQARHHAALNGIGIAVATQTDYPLSPDLCAIPIAHNTVYLDYYCCCLKKRLRRPLMKRTFNALQSRKKCDFE